MEGRLAGLLMERKGHSQSERWDTVGSWQLASRGQASPLHNSSLAKTQAAAAPCYPAMEKPTLRWVLQATCG